MTHIKRFDELNEEFFYYSDYYDLDLLQEVIEGMRPSKETNGEYFKKELREFNAQYPCKHQKRMSNVFGKQVAWWVDIELFQDVIDRMNSALNKNASKYKEDLKYFLQ